MKKVFLKNDKGSITIFILLSCLFFLITVTSVGVYMTNKNHSVERKYEQIKLSYEKNVGKEKEVYDKIMSEDPLTYTIYFINNGNKNRVFAKTSGEMPGYNEIPEKLGYTFMGWYDNEDYTKGTQYYDLNCQNVKSYDGKADITLYPGWKVNKYTLTINPNGGTWNETTSNTIETQNYDTIYNVTNDPTREGYVFGGWKLTSGKADITYFNDSNIIKQYKIESTTSTKPSVYNNKSNGTVKHTIIEDETSSTGYSMKIVTNGEATPGAGGFVNYNYATSGCFYYHKIVAKIPIGYKLNMASNPGGVGYGYYWLTSSDGTGEWETYIYLHYSGYNGPFSSFGHVYVSGTDDQNVTWYIRESTMYQKGGGVENLRATSNILKFVDSDVTLTAHWTKSGVGLTFDRQGGTFGNGTVGTKWTATSKMFIYESTYTTTKLVPYYISDTDFTIYKTGYTFDGWYTAPTGGTKIFDASGKLIGGAGGYSNTSGKWLYYDNSFTIYARWIEN